MELDGFAYSTLTDHREIVRYILSVCEQEWSPADFDDYSNDLYDQRWELRQIAVIDILPQQKLLDSPNFIADVTPRIAKQRELYENGVSIPPLILRGSDFFLFDGYARWHLFKELDIKYCLAYISV